MLVALADARVALAGPTLRVVGASRFDARLTRAPHSHASVAVAGTLVDDVDHPIGGAPVSLRFNSPDGAALPVWPCEGDGATPLAVHPGAGATLVTGADGAFCAQATPQAGKGETRVTLAWSGTELVSATHLELTIDPSLAVVTLAFDPDPRVIWLGAGTFVWNAAASVEADEGGAPPDSPAGLALRLTDERGAALGEATTDPKGSARFIVSEAKVGPPGPGELRLYFDGDTRHAKATRAIACERRALVALRPHVANGAESGGQAVVAEESEAGTTVDLDVTSSAGPVPGGSVEGIADGAVIGATPVAAGRARLTVRWPGDGAPRSHLDARYVPDAPWYVAGTPLSLLLDVHATMPWRRVGVVGAGLFLFGWFVLSRSRLLTPPRRVDATLREPLAPAASIELVAEHPPDAPRPRSWAGRVVDGHDGELVRGAKVTLERASFTGVEELARATTDESGRFELDATQAQPGDQMTAEGVLHARFARPAPPRGVVVIHLVLRRRAVLRRLVEWAKRRGPPFDAPPDPTPAHVRRMASEDAATVRWAHAVEEAAFGNVPVDAAHETEIDRLGHERDKS